MGISPAFRQGTIAFGRSTYITVHVEWTRRVIAMGFGLAGATACASDNQGLVRQHNWLLERARLVHLAYATLTTVAVTALVLDVKLCTITRLYRVKRQQQTLAQVECECFRHNSFTYLRFEHTLWNSRRRRPEMADRCEYEVALRPESPE